MKTAGIICEYNPFHRGHAWQIGETRRLLGAACGDSAAKHSFYGFAEGFLAAVEKQCDAKCRL